MKKITISLLIMAMLLVGLVGTAGAQAYNVTVQVDGSRVTFPDQKPYIDSNGRTLVPIRFIAEKMGADVGWDENIRLVTIDKDGTSIELTIGDNKAKVNGSWKTFDTKAVIENGRTMVPLRFVSETLGADVDWDGDARIVYIWTEEKPVEKPKDGVGEMLPPVGQRDPDHIEPGKRTIPRHDYTFPYAMDWINAIKIEDGYISGRVPTGIPDDVWLRMSMINGNLSELDIQMKQGDSFRYKIVSDKGSLSFDLGMRGNSESKSSAGIMIPSGEVKWSNR